jgi:diaminopimelate epimerase
MAKPVTIPFVKFHGLANDFIVVLSKDAPRAYGDVARAICARNTGVGADGLLILTPSKGRKAPARLRFFNADGSEAEMSGNGIRCAGAYLLSRGMARSPVRVATGGGIKTLRLVESGEGKWSFRVAMGRPILAPGKIPFRGEKSRGPVVDFPLSTHRGRISVTVTSMGNPHCSLFVGSFGGIDWARLGREIESHPLFPNRTNVEFIKVLSRDEIDIRFWERGVGMTMSSGTGSCAAAVASILNRRTGRKVRVRTLGGTLDIAWPPGGEITLTGPAERIAEGTFYYRAPR